MLPCSQSRSQSPRYPCPAEREFPVPLDKGNEGSGNEIALFLPCNLESRMRDACICNFRGREPRCSREGREKARAWMTHPVIQALIFEIRKLPDWLRLISSVDKTVIEVKYMKTIYLNERPLPLIQLRKRRLKNIKV